MIRLLFMFLIVLTSLCGGTAQASGPEVPVTFSLSAPQAASVTIAGSFNQWDPSSHALTGPDLNGSWTITFRLAPGRYEYLFQINKKEWITDPRAPSVDDSMGGRNSVVLIGTD